MGGRQSREHHVNGLKHKMAVEKHLASVKLRAGEQAAADSARDHILRDVEAVACV
jgi:hypothetical protein